MKSKKVTLSKIVSFFIICSIFIIMFQGNIVLYFPIINYYDEFLALLLFIIYFFRIKGKFKKSDLNILICLLFMCVIGILGNVCSEINNSIYIILIDAFGILKIFLALIAVKNLFNKDTIEDIIYNLSRCFEVYLFVAAVFYIVGIMFHIDWLFKSSNFGISAYGFLHGNSGAGWLGYYLEAIYCVLTMARERLRFSRISRGLCLILAILTMKAPALLFVVLVIFFELVIKRKKLKVWHLIMVGVIGLTVGWRYIERYLLKEGEARAYLLATGAKIANKHFPIGLGFGTFGSDMSRKFYSQAYLDYGLNSVYGLAINGKVNYITDNYWGMILGQFGFVGIFLLAYIFYSIFVQINNIKNSNHSINYGFLAMFFSFMAGGFASSYLTSHLGVLCFLIMGLFLNSKYNSYFDQR